MTVFLFLSLLQRHKNTRKSNLRWTTPSVEKCVVSRRATPLLRIVRCWYDFWHWFSSPFKRCVIILHLRCYKRRGTFAYNVITCLIDIYSKGHRNSIEHVISKQDENIGISPNRETAAGESTEAWERLQMQMNNWFVARRGHAIVLQTWSRVCKYFHPGLNNFLLKLA